MGGRDSYVGLSVKAGEALIPLDVVLELTHHCNFRCQHCYIPDFHQPDVLSTARINALLEELVEAGTLRLTLSGGEVFLRRDWLVIARRARSLGFELRLFTNGALVTAEIANAVRSLYAPVEISLYSMNEAEFERMTQTPGSFARTIRGVELLRERDIEVKLKVPMTLHNFAGIDAVFEYARKVGADCASYHAIVAKKNGDPGPISLRVPPEQLLPYLAGPHSGSGIPDECADECGSPRRDENGVLCAAATRLCAISATGDVKACTVLPGSCGSLREKSFKEIWEGSPWLNRIRGIRLRDLGVCARCPKIAYCGRCHAQALVEDGEIVGPSTWACANAAAVEDAAKLNAGS